MLQCTARKSKHHFFKTEISPLYLGRLPPGQNRPCPRQPCEKKVYEIQMRNQHFFDTIVKNLTKLASLEKTEILRHRSRIQFTPKAVVVLQYFARTYLSSQWVQIISEVAPAFSRKKYETSHVCYDDGMNNEEIYLVKKNSFLQKKFKFCKSSFCGTLAVKVA